MKKLILSLATVLALAGTAGAAIVQYTFDDLAASGASSGLTPTPITLSGVTQQSSGSGKIVIGGNGTPFQWNASDYIEFTITPQATPQYQAKVTSITFVLSSSINVTGAHVELDYGNNFGTVVDSGAFSIATAGTTKQISFNMSDTIAPIRVRFYAGDIGNKETITFDNISVDGSVGLTTVPEPVNVALILFGCTFAGVGIGRKFLKKKAA